MLVAGSVAHEPVITFCPNKLHFQRGPGTLRLLTGKITNDRRSENQNLSALIGLSNLLRDA